MTRWAASSGLVTAPPVELDAAGADDGSTDAGASDAGAADAAPPGTGAPADAEHAASPARKTARSTRFRIFMSQRR